MRRAALLLILALTLATSAHALSADVEIDPQDPSSNQALNCLVNATGTGTLSANITWYVDSTPHGADTETIGLQNGTQNSTSAQGQVESTDTTRDDQWICQADVSNQTTTISVNSSAQTIENGAPSVTFPTTTQTVTEGVLYNVNATATDPDADPITGWVSSDLNASEYGGEDLFDIQNDGSISFTPTYEQRGNHTMALLASDGDLLGGRNVLYVVEYVNQDPEFDPALADQTINTTVVWQYDIFTSDREADPMNITLLSSELAKVVLNQTGNDTATLSLTTGNAAYEDRGAYNVTVAVIDENNHTRNTTSTFTLNITAQNDPPVLENITSPQATQGSSFLLDVNATDVNANDTLQFSILAPTCALASPWTIETTDNSTNATGRINVSTLTNDHVACRDVTIRVRDFEDGSPKDIDTQDVTLNITNTNDAPTINETAASPGTYGQLNISNLTAAEGVAFSYTVNAADPDELTYEGEAVSFSDNTSLFTISTDGTVSFTPGAGDVGNHTINITVSDDQGLTDSALMQLEIVPNDAPVLTAPTNKTCAEDAQCQELLQAFDDDNAENLSYAVTEVSQNTTSGSSVDSSWTLNQTTYNHTNATKNYTNLMVGSYVYNVTVTDRWGASDSALWSVNVTNTNDAPYYDQNQDQVRDVFSLPSPIVETRTSELLIHASDDDLLNNQDTLSLDAIVDGPDPNVLSVSKTAQATWFVEFTPNTASDGEYNVTFNLTDLNASNDTVTYSFTVYNVSDTPNITHVAPRDDNGTTNLTPGSTAGMNGSTSVTLVEPENYNFSVNVTDSDTPPSNVTLEWFVDGTSVKTATADSDTTYSVDLDYFSSGTYEYRVVATDNLLSSTNFTWNVTVQNTNRPPVFQGSLDDRNLTQATTIQGMMDAFYDPDDDLNSNGEIDNGETNNLDYSATISNFNLISIAFTGQDVQLDPLDNGNVTVTYAATDSSGASASSNTVTYQTDKPDEEPTALEGGGGGSSSTPVPVPVQDDPEPETIQIITPEELTIYRNETVAAPLTIGNTGERSLRGVSLSANTSAQNVTMRFSEQEFELIEPGQENNVTLYITNFRTDGTYRITVHADVRDPEVNDSAVIFINSLEQSSTGDATDTRITFARDLVSSNPECLELNELLSQAQRAARTGQAAEADRLISAAIEGCRYLISESNKQREAPDRISLDWLAQFRYANHVLVGLLLALLGVAGFLIAHYVSAAKTQNEE